MKILFLTVGNEVVASTRVRVYGYLPFLKENRIKYKIISYTSDSKCKRLISMKKDTPPQILYEMCYKLFIVIKFLISSKNYDIIFIQKVVLPKVLWWVLKRTNKKIIFDYDDAIYLYRDIRDALKTADIAIVSNRYLKDYTSKYSGNIYEIPSPVTVKDGLNPVKKRTVLGWIGSPENTEYLLCLISVFKSLRERFREQLDIKFMGAKPLDEFRTLNIDVIDWSFDKENSFLNELDIGIMPLRDNTWCRGKGGYKLLLYMSRGIACVASPVGMNKQIIKSGVNGYLAVSRGEWIGKISLLVESPSLREKFGKAGLDTVKKYYSYERNFCKLKDALYKITDKKEHAT